MIGPQVQCFDTAQLNVIGQAMRLDNDATVYSREVKAVTYHELAIRQTPEGYEATVILDI